MPEMCVTKNKLTRFEPHWNFILPHINIWSSAERRPLKLYLFLIWWAKLDYKNKHTWSICIIPVAEIHLHWIMTMTKTNKWGLSPYSSPRPGFCFVRSAHPSTFSSSLKTNASFLPWYQSAVATIKDIDLLYWYKLQGDGLQSLRHGEGRKGWAQANDNHKVLSCGRLGYE